MNGESINVILAFLVIGGACIGIGGWQSEKFLTLVSNHARARARALVVMREVYKEEIRKSSEEAVAEVV